MNTFYKILETKNAVSYNFVYKSTISFIEKAIHDQLKHSIKPDPEKDITNIIQFIIQRQACYQFYRRVEGVKLEGLEALIVGDVELFVFTNTNEKELQGYREYNSSNDFFDEAIMPFVKKHFLGRICIRTTAVGDEIKAKDIATKKIKQVINILRFIVCLLAHERIYENLIKINLLAESCDSFENTIFVNLNSSNITLTTGTTRKPLQELPIDSELLKNLKEYSFFDDLINILTKDEKTELEKAILACIYWIGEAQNDFDQESAFIKYWVALETLFTITKEEITESLAKGVAILLAFGGYKIVKINEVKKIFKAVEELYDKRGKIIHRGIYGNVTPMEMTEICKYAVWCVLSCLGLRSQGYQTLEQIKNETSRLYNLSTRASY